MSNDAEATGAQPAIEGDGSTPLLAVKPKKPRPKLTDLDILSERGIFSILETFPKIPFKGLKHEVKQVVECFALQCDRDD